MHRNLLATTAHQLRIHIIVDVLQVWSKYKAF